MRGIGEKRCDEGDGDASASKKSADGYGKLLQEQGEEGAGQAETEGQKQREPEGRVMAEIGGEL